ncbi:MAG: hypothetical protein OXR73_13225 [Myxococcales bacterium]|nr:hypothetical protein [Myxococcales bacterium]
MTIKDPERLKATGQTPENLARALRALGRDSQDTARVARVADRLATTGVPPAAPAGGSWASRVRPSLTAKGMGVGLGLGLLALGAIGHMLMRDRPATVDATVDQQPRQAGDSLPSAPSETPAVAPVPPTGSTDLPSALRTHEQGAVPTTRVSTPAAGVVPNAHRGGGNRTERPSESPISRARKKRATRGPAANRVRVGPTARGAAPSRVPPQKQIETTPARTQEPATSGESAMADRRQEPSARAQVPEPDGAAPPPPAHPARPRDQGPSEVALLREARRLASGEPEAALRLLREHSTRFSNGILVPERELLAIEVLRRLGRTREAQRRMRRFETRYPQSIHRQRLEQPAPSAAP